MGGCHEALAAAGTALLNNRTQDEGGPSQAPHTYAQKSHDGTDGRDTASQAVNPPLSGVAAANDSAAAVLTRDSVAGSTVHSAELNSESAVTAQLPSEAVSATTQPTCPVSKDVQRTKGLVHSASQPNKT